MLVNCNDEPDKGARLAVRVRGAPDSNADIESDVAKANRSFDRLPKRT
jgi:hypothetical protein